MGMGFVKRSVHRRHQVAMPTPKAAAASLPPPAYEEEEAVVADNAAAEQNHNNNNNLDLQGDDEDEHLFRATGFRYSFAQQRGFPYPWCAKKHGRKGWIVRDFPPTAYYYATSYPFSASRLSNTTTGENGGVEFEGWKEAKKVFCTRQILLERLQQSIGDETPHNSASSMENNENTVVTTHEAAAAQRRAMIDNWFQKTPAVMKQQRKIHNKTLQLAAEKKRKREELDLKKKQQKELLVMKEKERVQQMREKKQQQQQQVSHQEVVTTAAAAIESTNMQQRLPISNLEKDGGTESPSRYRLIIKQKAVVSSPSRSKRKGTQPIRRDNKYRDIERSFIENQSLLLRSPVKQTTHESNEFVLPSPSTPTRMANPLLPQLQSSPTRIKYKRTQPRKNHHHQQQQQRLNSSQQSNSVILGDDPLMDQMIEDIVKEFTTDGGGPMVAHGHLFDVGAVSALREAAMDMVVHNLEEKNKEIANTTAPIGGIPAATACSKTSPQLDHDDKRMELMLEQLIGEVAYDSGCKFDGHAVEALKMAAREIVTTENDDMAKPPVKGTDQSSAKAAADVASKSSGKGKSEETERSPPSTSNPSYDIQPLQLDSEDSNFSEVGGMIAQLVDDLGKETDFQFDASAVDALKKASQQLL